MINWLLDVFREQQSNTVIIYRDEEFDYDWLLASVQEWRGRLKSHNIANGQVVALISDYSPCSIAAILALIENKNVIVPITSLVEAQKFIDISEAEVVITLRADGDCLIEYRFFAIHHPLLNQLRQSGEPGLIVFTSGSTGTSKAVLHSFARILEKYKTPGRKQRILVFLLLDHMGGINTLFYTLANGGTLVIPLQRTPDEVCRAIEQYQVDVLPVSPTFLNLLLMSETKYDLSSLKLITYGTEPMPEYTLKRLRESYPSVKLLQTYGLSEVGVLRTSSKDSWIKIRNDETKVVDGILWVKAQSAMLGYLNAPSPFDEEGWLNTEDEVVVEGDYLRILGRRSELINVGGQKVYPTEVENVLLGMENVLDVSVRGEANPITGQIVVARMTLAKPEDVRELRRRIRQYCAERLLPYKIPVKVEIADEPQYSWRFKKMRRVT